MVMIVIHNGQNITAYIAIIREGHLFWTIMKKCVRIEVFNF